MKKIKDEDIIFNKKIDAILVIILKQVNKLLAWLLKKLRK